MTVLVTLSTVAAGFVGAIWLLLLVVVLLTVAGFVLFLCKLSLLFLVAPGFPTGSQ